VSIGAFQSTEDLGRLRASDGVRCHGKIELPYSSKRHLMKHNLTIAAHAILIAAAFSNTVSAAGSELAAATQYPVRPIRLLLGLPAGGSADIVARIVSAKLAETLGGHIVVDNRPGGSGLIAPQLAARATPDGYTLLFRASFFSELVASVVRSMSYDLLADFAPVSLVIKVPNVLAVNPQLPIRTVAELIAHAKANPGTLNYASSGPGSSAHLAMEALKKQSGTNLVHIPYTGAPQAISALLGGEVQVMFGNAPAQIPQVRTGKLRALAVTSAARNPQLSPRWRNRACVISSSLCGLGSSHRPASRSRYSRSSIRRS